MANAIAYMVDVPPHVTVADLTLPQQTKQMHRNQSENMINKRLLVKENLSHNDENSFYDKKAKLNLSSKKEKQSF